MDRDGIYEFKNLLFCSGGFSFHSSFLNKYHSVLLNWNMKWYTNVIIFIFSLIFPSTLRELSCANLKTIKNECKKHFFIFQAVFSRFHGTCFSTIPSTVIDTLKMHLSKWKKCSKCYADDGSQHFLKIAQTYHVKHLNALCTLENMKRTRRQLKNHITEGKIHSVKLDLPHLWGAG